MKTLAIMILLSSLAIVAATRHAASQVDNTTPPPGDVQPPNTVVPRDGCVTAECHAGVKTHQFIHGPVLVNACDSCHTLTDPQTHAYKLTREPDQICVFCHVVEVPQDSFTHEPFATGACLSCHEPHGSPWPAMLRGRKYDDICKTCHEDVTGAHELVHGPVAAGACGACHEPHAAPHENLLLASGREMCLRCHVTTSIEIDTRRVVHDPVYEDCQICHDPHATDSPGILIEDPVTLCTGCHPHVAEAINNATTQHAAITSQRSCLNCHASHASDHGALLRSDPMTLCFECHDKPIELADGSVLRDMKQIIESGSSLHGPVAQRSCAPCHEIHGSGHRRLLAQEYPQDIYYPFSETAYALCFTCHDRQLVMLEFTDSATNFRNGDQNLHYVHVHRDEKGRSCRVCHDSHAANRERHIRDEIPFGPSGWMLPIGFEQSEQGGTCAPGCHKPFEYNRVEPVDFPDDDEDQDWRGDDLVPGRRAGPEDATQPPPEK